MFEQRPAIVDEDLARYVQQLETIFVDLRGRGVLWTPDDVGRAAKWRAAGVSLALARRVVAARVDALRHVHGEGAAVPFELRHYERAVKDALGGRSSLGRLDVSAASPWHAFETRTPTASQPLPSTTQPLDDGVLAWLARLAREGEALRFDDPAVAVATSRAASACAALLTKDLGADEIDQAVAAIRARLLRQLRQGIGPTEAATLDQSVAAALEPGLGQRARKERNVALQMSYLSERFGARWPGPDGWAAAPAFPWPAEPA